MTNAELIARLQTLSPDAKILVFVGDERMGNRIEESQVYEAMDMVQGFYIAIQVN
jgi:hypothetical protein